MKMLYPKNELYRAPPHSSVMSKDRQACKQIRYESEANTCDHGNAWHAFDQIARPIDFAAHEHAQHSR